MANITLSGILLDPTSEFAVGDEVRFTHNSTTGETIKSAISTLTIPPDGSYSIDLQYGLVLVEYKDIRSSQFKNLGVATVNGTNTATSIPELLNALVPVSSAELIEFQAILADTVTAQTAAENAATTAEAFAYQLTTTDLIASTATFAAETSIQTSGFTTSGDGGSGSWKQNGVTGQTASQTPAQLGGALLNDGNGNQWSIVKKRYLNPCSLGAVGDLVADDLLPVLACCSSGQSLAINKDKNFLCILNSPSDALTFLEGVTVKGKGIITLKNTSGIYMEFVNVRKSNITIDTVRFVGDIFAGTSGFFFNLGDTVPADNNKFLNGSVDLGNYIVGATGFHSVHGFSFNDNFNNHTWDKWTFTRCNYATIKVNTDTSSQFNTRIINCDFKNNVKGNLTGFNTPSGNSKDIQITGNYFLRELAYFINIQDQTLMGGVAGGENVVFSNNTGSGYGRDVIHMEETKGRIAIANNVWKHLGGGEDGGITIRSNKIGGAAQSVSDLTITGNVGVVDGTAVAGSRGVWLVWDSDGALGSTNTTITGNTMVGYETGMDLGDAVDDVLTVHANTIKDSATGIIATTPLPSIANNTIMNATFGLTNKRTGIWGKNNFVDCTTIFNVGSENSFIAKGFSYKANDFLLENGSVNKVMSFVQAPKEAKGELSYTMRYDVSSHSEYSADIRFESDILTSVSRVFRASTGNPSISLTDTNVVKVDSNKLAVTASNSSGSDKLVDITVDYDGVWYGI